VNMRKLNAAKTRRNIGLRKPFENTTGYKRFCNYLTKPVMFSFLPKTQGKIETN
jgi:hypothetical protein